jgi:dihydrolipoamide dehydrogenase
VVRSSRPTILFATGRTACTGDIGLETIDLSPGSRLDVDDTCLVRSRRRLLTPCDANHRALLTHQGKYQAGWPAPPSVLAPTGS